MSDELAQAGIEIYQGYGAEQLDCKPDLIVVGNVMKRGMPVVERMLNERFNYVSGPQFLEDLYLRQKTVLAVSGTHGKTTTTAMLTWILECAGKNPGFLVGGVPENFGYSARGSDSEYFVIEADEYDSAFFDKRSKFVHYHPNVAIINNIEFDHADIFASINDIKKQFHQMVRIIPSTGTVIYPAQDTNVVDTINMGLWSKGVAVGSPACPYALCLQAADGSVFTVHEQGAGSATAVEASATTSATAAEASVATGAVAASAATNATATSATSTDRSVGAISLGKEVAKVTLQATGVHNAHNAFMAMLAAAAIGIPLAESAKSLATFKMPKRRMELVGTIGDIHVYDDFAHHPTAIATTIDGLRQRLGAKARIVCVFEPRSNSMKMGANRELLGKSFAEADEIFVYQNEAVHWDMSILERDCPKPLHIVATNTNDLIAEVIKATDAHTSIIVMSNGGFENVKGRLVQALQEQAQH